MIPQRSRERSASSRHSRSIASLSSQRPVLARTAARAESARRTRSRPFAPAGRLDGGGEALLGRRVVAALEGDRPERAEQERPEVVGQLGAREGEGGLGLGLGAVGIAPLEARARGGVEQAGPLLGRPDGAELPLRPVEEGARRLHVAAAQPDHPDLERQEGRVAADCRGRRRRGARRAP